MEILLWLSRDEGESLSTRQVRLDSLLETLVQELRYLLKDIPMEVTLEVTPAQVEVAETAAVLSNLIRNAFQHTWEGQVAIRQHHNQVSITNHNASGETVIEELGFGLGLQLTRRLCQRL